MLLNELLIRDSLSTNELHQRVPEQVRVLAVVVPVGQLIQVGLQVLRAKLLAEVGPAPSPLLGRAALVACPA